MKSDSEPALSSLGCRDQSIRQRDEQRNRGKSVSTRSVHDQNDSKLEERWRVKIGFVHAIRPWVPEHVGFLLSLFEVGRDGKTAFERLNGKTAKVLEIMFAEGILWKRRRAGGPLRNPTYIWEDGVCLGEATSGEFIVGGKRGTWLTRTVRKKLK